MTSIHVTIDGRPECILSTILAYDPSESLYRFVNFLLAHTVVTILNCCSFLGIVYGKETSSREAWPCRISDDAEQITDSPDILERTINSLIHGA
jgi:hypothetical protein